MAIKFDSNTHAVRLDNLNINDTFIYDNRIGLVVEVQVLNMDFDEWEPQRF